MWLRDLHVENFRGFPSLDVAFDERFTLLLGGNGAGKTAVLDAIKVGLASFFAAIDQGPVSVGIDAEDARRVVYDLGGIPDLQEQWPVVVSATVDPGGLANLMPPSLVPVVVWRRTRDGRDGRTAWAGEAEIRQLGQRVQEAVRGGQPILLPLVAYYGTQRLWRERRQTAARQGLGNRLDGYVDCLDISASERSLTEWMRQRTLEELQQVQTNPGYRHPQLAAVERAVADCVEGVDRFWFDLMHDEVRMASGAKIQTFAMLSDGYRNMVAMVADLAERAAVLNPQMGVDAPRETPGVVLIDEIELHLHPKWQRTVVSSLRRAFPRMQFIATTHSPQVLSTVGRTQVRLFRDNQLVASDLYVGGRDANELLEDIFGVSARPEAMKGELEQLFQFLDDRDFGNARRKLTELEAQLGATDADVVRARWILDTEAGASVLTGS